MLKDSFGRKFPYIRLDFVCQFWGEVVFTRSGKENDLISFPTSPVSNIGVFFTSVNKPSKN